MSKLSLLAVSLLSASVAASSNYFLLESPSGCIGRSSNGGDLLLLKECDSSDDTVLWRQDGQSRFRSYTNDAECMHVGLDSLNTTAGLKRGSGLYTKPCRSAKKPFQHFDSDWSEGPLTLMERPDLCVVHFGATPVIGESRIMMVPCAELGGPRLLGWNPASVEFDYVLLDSLPGSPRGGCIGQNEDPLKNDALYYKQCRSNDDTLQWRLDNQGRMRSKLDDTMCLQAENRPNLVKGVETLKRGSQMYAKPCAIPGSLKDGFQVVGEAWASNGAKGPLSLKTRPELCITHFGADPIFGESRIILQECDALVGRRAEGWEGIDPCSTPPSCNARFMDMSELAETINVDVGVMASTRTVWSESGVIHAVMWP